MIKNILIMSPSYDENVGGFIVLHKLCDLLNSIGKKAFLCPYSDNCIISPTAFWKDTFRSIRRHSKLKRKSYKTNPAFNTPVLSQVPHDIQSDNWIVVYPEVVNGNPLRAKNVVRWFLHQPGFHSGTVMYCKNEFHVKYNSAICDFIFPGCTLSDEELKIVHYPLEHYNQDQVAGSREGSAYCLRKGKGKEMVHDIGNSTLIDGLTHQEIGSIFKKVQYFVSYDTLTAYSRFAVLCGCESIVIPDPGVLKEEWYPNESDRWGISYGFSDVEREAAKSTAHLVLPQILIEHKKSMENAACFFEKLEAHFS